MASGVAVVIGRGTPLMKLFRAYQSPRLADDEVAAGRLMAIASRTKAGRSPEVTDEVTPDPEEPSDDEPTVQ